MDHERTSRQFKLPLYPFFVFAYFSLIFFLLISIFFLFSFFISFPFFSLPFMWLSSFFQFFSFKIRCFLFLFFSWILLFFFYCSLNVVECIIVVTELGCPIIGLIVIVWGALVAIVRAFFFNYIFFTPRIPSFRCRQHRPRRGH